MFGFGKSRQFKEAEAHFIKEFGGKVNDFLPDDEQARKDFDRICKESNLSLQSRIALLHYQVAFGLLAMSKIAYEGGHISITKDHLLGPEQMKLKAERLLDLAPDKSNAVNALRALSNNVDSWLEYVSSLSNS